MAKMLCNRLKVKKTLKKKKVEDIASSEEAADAAVEESLMSSAGALAPLAGLGLVGGGGGGGGGGSSSSTFLDSGTSSYTYHSNLDDTWRARQEYKNVNIYRTVNYPSYAHPYTLLGVDDAYAYGLSGVGYNIAILDNGFYAHKEFGNYSNSTGSTSQHGTHVAGIAAAEYNNNYSSFNTGWSGTYANLNYGIHGVAHAAATQHNSYSDTFSPTGWTSATNAATTVGSVVQNNSWGFDEQYGAADIGVVSNYMTNNDLTALETLVAYQSIDTDGDGYYDVGANTSAYSWTTDNWQSYISALDQFQNDGGVVVFALSNDNTKSDADVSAGLPVLFPDLADAWITVGNVLVSGSTASSSNTALQSAPCGSTAEYCLVADGNYITSTDDDSSEDYAALSGTSFAAPQVSGLVALLKQAFPNHTPEQLVDRLLASAEQFFFYSYRFNHLR